MCDICVYLCIAAFKHSVESAADSQKRNTLEGAIRKPDQASSWLHETLTVDS